MDDVKAPDPAEPPSSGSPLLSFSGRQSTQSERLHPTAANGDVQAAPPRTPPRERFPSHRHRHAFRRHFFPGADTATWNDWRWQLRNRIKSLAEAERVFRLTEDERSAIARHHGSLPLGITPYYTALMDRDDPTDPLRRTHIPVGDEYVVSAGEAADPLDEDRHLVAPGLVHRYPDRVLFLATGFCATYCRYCTRARMVGNPGGEYAFSIGQWQQALAYIEAHPEIRDVLVSGGDPLTLADDKLDWLLGRIRRIRHVEFVRLGSKVPAVLPMRVTRALVRVLRRHRPVWLSLHFTHPAELTPETATACDRLADAGVPLGSQTVLLKGVNDSSAVMRRLVHGLLRCRVRPYYLYQCDPISGSAHLRTPIETGIDIIRDLRGHTTGYAVPQFVIDAPNGGGKIPLMPDYLVGRDGDDVILRNFEGRHFRYPDAGGRFAVGRPVAER